MRNNGLVSMLYVMHNWKCVHVLLTLEKVEVGVTSDNIKVGCDG
jgi:hypothetical protein